jgi:citrate synthase
MTDPTAPTAASAPSAPTSASSTASTPSPAAAPADDRPYSPGLEGAIAAESAIGLVDGENGRLLYRGYPIGQLVKRGTYAEVADLLWTGEWHPGVELHPTPISPAVLTALRQLPRTAAPMDALRTAVSVWGAEQNLTWPITPDQARALTAFSPSALAAFGRLRQGLDPVEPDTTLDLAGGFLQQLTGSAPDPAAAKALDAYFIVGAEHGLNASTFACRVIVATRSDLASGVTGAIGALKGPIHGGAPSEVVNQLHEIGSPERAEQWVRDAVGRGERIMGFGHRVYRAYDPRAAALREVAEGMAGMADWLSMAVQVEDVVLRVLAELKPGRTIKTNVEYYAAAVLQGVGLDPALFPATFALARHAGWTAHAIEQSGANRLIRPDMRYTGPMDRDLPA